MLQFLRDSVFFSRIPRGDVSRVARAAERFRDDFFLNLILFCKLFGLHANPKRDRRDRQGLQEDRGGPGGVGGENAPKGTSVNRRKNGPKDAPENRPGFCPGFCPVFFLVKKIKESLGDRGCKTKIRSTSSDPQFRASVPTTRARPKTSPGGPERAADGCSLGPLHVRLKSFYS